MSQGLGCLNSPEEGGQVLAAAVFLPEVIWEFLLALPGVIWESCLAVVTLPRAELCPALPGSHSSPQSSPGLSPHPQGSLDVDLAQKCGTTLGQECVGKQGGEEFWIPVVLLPKWDFLQRLPWHKGDLRCSNQQETVKISTKCPKSK